MHGDILSPVYILLKTKKKKKKLFLFTSTVSVSETVLWSYPAFVTRRRMVK